MGSCTGRRDMTERLLKMAFNSNQSINQYLKRNVNITLNRQTQLICDDVNDDLHLKSNQFVSVKRLQHASSFPTIKSVIL